MMTWSNIFFSNPSSFLMNTVILMHDYVMMFLLSIMISVLLGLSYNIFSNFFKLNFYENHNLESVWTLVPFFILLFIVIPSLETLYNLDTCVFCGLTVSVMGHQWYWSYFLKDFSVSCFDSYMLPLDSSNIRLLDTDNRLIVPSSTPMRFLISSSDVIHSWTIPSLGVKMDAVPGRINQLCFSCNRPGIFFGQCSEICGSNHSFMPIVLESIPMKDFIKLI